MSGATVSVANAVVGIGANRDLLKLTVVVRGEGTAHVTNEAQALRHKSVVSHAPLVGGAGSARSHGEAEAAMSTMRSTPHGDAARQDGLACPITGTNDNATTTSALRMRRNMKQDYPILVIDLQSFSRDSAGVLQPPPSH